MKFITFGSAAALCMAAGLAVGQTPVDQPTGSANPQAGNAAPPPTSVYTTRQGVVFASYTKLRWFIPPAIRDCVTATCVTSVCTARVVPLCTVTAVGSGPGPCTCEDLCDGFSTGATSASAVPGVWDDHDDNPATPPQCKPLTPINTCLERRAESEVSCDPYDGFVRTKACGFAGMVSTSWNGGAPCSKIEMFLPQATAQAVLTFEAVEAPGCSYPMTIYVFGSAAVSGTPYGPDGNPTGCAEDLPDPISVCTAIENGSNINAKPGLPLFGPLNGTLLPQPLQWNNPGGTPITIPGPGTYVLEMEIESSNASSDVNGDGIVCREDLELMFAAVGAVAGTDPEYSYTLDTDHDGVVELAEVLALADHCAMADFNCDGFVDFFDELDYDDAFQNNDMAADYNGDGFLDFFDYDEFLRLFECE